MFEVQSRENALRRAWTATTRARPTIWYGLFITVSAVVVPTAGGLLAALVTQDTVMLVSIPILMLMGWLFLIVLLVFSFNMMRAPYRQRDEARQMVARLSTDEVAVAIEKLQAKQSAKQFAHWSSRIALGATVLDSGFNREGLGELVKIGLVEPRIHPGNEYPVTSPLYHPAHTRYFLTPLGCAVVARLEEDVADKTENAENKH